MVYGSNIRPLRRLVAWVILLFALARPALSRADDTASDTADDTANAQLIARGKYLADLSDCAGCHTNAPTGNPPKPSPAFAGGLPMGSPFGTIWTSNITPDPVYGIGKYSYEDFMRAVRDGIAPGGKRLYPAMPFGSFVKITDDDMRALYAFFMHGVKPVAKPAPKTELPFPFNQRWALAVWDAVMVPHSRYVPRPDRSAQWNRGAYLVQAFGHCGACHTPRGLAYEERGYNEGDPLYLTGGTNDNWYAPNLTGAPDSGLGRFSEDDIVGFLRHGHGGGLVTFGSMVEVVEDSGQYMTDDDLHAIATYLKSLPPREQSGHVDTGQARNDATVNVLRTGSVNYPGAGLYNAFCARCHHADGRGEPGKYPRLAGNPMVIAPHATSLIRLLIEGGESPSTNGAPKPERMPSFLGKLNDTEMARVLSFIRNAWGNEARPVTPREVEQLRTKLRH